MSGPEPTTGTRYDTYLVPRSKTAEKNGIYDLLLKLGWRFDASTVRWHTPETATHQASGRLEYGKDFDWATIQPPNQPGSDMREKPILRMVRTSLGWVEYVGTEAWTNDATTKEN